jgi:carbon-monoxide dehydrogenase medium subunit
VKPPPFLYTRPETLSEALAALADAGEDAKVLAGGQSLVPLLNFRLARPSVLVDLNWVQELATLERSNGTIRAGAMVRQRTAEQSPVVQEGCPLIVRGLKYVGHLQIRNRGTVGGSIAHADPAAELPAIALATGAEMEVRSVRGERTVPAAEFFQGPFTTALAPDEILTAVRFPVTEGARVGFLELARRSGDFALGGIAAVVRFEGDSGKTVSEASLVALGMGGEPRRLAGSEDALRGRELTEDVLRDAGSAASREVDPFTDVHADAEYRKELVGVLLTRVLREVRGE